MQDNNNLPAELRNDVIFASNEIPLWRIDQAKKEDLLVIIVAQQFIKMAHVADKDIIIQAIAEDIANNLSVQYLSLKSIEIAITRGIQRQYKVDFVHLNVPVINDFIKCFIQEQMTILREERKRAETEKKENPAIEPIEVRMKSAYDNLIFYIEKNKALPIIWPLNLVYMQLEHIGEIAMSLSEKSKYKDFVAHDLMAQIRDCKLSGRFNEEKDLLRTLNDTELLSAECRSRIAKEWATTYLQTISL